MTAAATFDYDSAAIARRLKVIRHHVAGDNQSEFARRLGVGQSRWNNFERGYPVNLRICAMLRDIVPGLSIDWIVEGATYNMPDKLADALIALEKTLFPSKAQSSRGSKPGASRKR